MVEVDLRGMKDGGQGPRWRFDPTVNLGHILTFVSILGLGISVYADLRSDIKNQQTTLVMTAKFFEAQIEDGRRAVTVVSEGVNRLERKVDTILTQTRR